MKENKKLKSMRLKYMHDIPNAGDSFSLVLARRYFSDNIIPCSREALTVPNLIFVGSFLRSTDAYSHICGAGCISSDPSVFKLPAAPKAVHCVRGPLTAELLESLGVRCPSIYADPGILAPELYPKKTSPTHKIGIIPHHLDAHLPWVDSCRDKGMLIIDALSPLDEYFEKLHRCEIVLSSSLHGIIFAHAYGIPALWIELSDNVIGNGFKFYDYYLSLGINPEKVNRVRITESTDPDEIAKSATVADQSKLIPPLKEAIHNAIEHLHQDQIYSNIRNVLLPLNSHNRGEFSTMIKRYLNRSTWYQPLKEYLRSHGIIFKKKL